MPLNWIQLVHYASTMCDREEYNNDYTKQTFQANPLSANGAHASSI